MAINNAEKSLGVQADFLTVAKEIALFHQEKWDGSGYPEGRKGEYVPISARLMAVADVYGALICRRVYKAAMPHSLAVSIIVRGSGQHFDPVIVDAFVALQGEFVAIAEPYADSDAALQLQEDSRRGALT